MASFEYLWGDALDRELGSADQTQLFTQERRQAAINEGAGEFCRLTDALALEFQFPLTTNVPTYDLPATIGTNAALVARWIEPWRLTQVTSTGAATVLTPPDFARRDRAWLDRYERGWRTVPSGTPRFWAIDRGLTGAPGPGTLPAANEIVLLTPGPSIPTGHTWILNVRAAAKPAPMVDPQDTPFTVATTPVSAAPRELDYYHQALVHWAAYQLEKLRRNYQVSQGQLQLFNSYVQEYQGKQQDETGESHVTYIHDYLGDASRNAGSGALLGVRTDRWFPE